jgi:hypothetical protein
MLRRTTLTLLFAALLSVLATSRDAFAQDTAAAETAATQWLAHVDAARYGESWTSAATAFKQAVTQEKWQDAAKQARARVGAFKSRTKKSATPKTNPAGAPAGDYVILQYDASFEQHPTTETVTAIRETDGAWRIVGYFVH